MDPTDIHLSLRLQDNSRTPYRVLADELKLSVNAVHKRIQALVDQGIIREFVARPGFAATGAVIVLIHGLSDKVPEELDREFSRHGSIWWLSAASGGYLYVGFYLHDLEELGTALDYVQSKTGMMEPKFSILANVPKPAKPPLDELDYQIIGSLSRDSRKPVVEISSDVGASTKTVRRRLNTMIENYTIELMINWYPDATNDITSMTHIKYRQGEKLDKETMMRDYRPNLVMAFQPLNAAREMLCITWNPTMKEMRNLIERLRADPRIESAIPNILYMGWIYRTWRDDLSTLPRAD